MRISDLFEAPDFDLMQRDEARRAWGAVSRELSTNGYDNFHYDHKLEAYTMSFGKFAVVIADGKDGDGGYVRSKGTDVIWIYTKRKHDPKWIASSREAEVVFAHEMIHAQDHTRTRGKIPAPILKGYAEYHNSPAELNAHYQEAMYQLDHMLKGHEHKIKNFDTFNRVALSVLKGGFWDTLREKNKRSIIKRLYKHYTEIFRGENYVTST